ncbi:GNAT family N-acetyltransferase [Phytoactinopolyspora mesophila]|uniref:GNAT family N-acetyltransferase n=1 Tax=Phytoactinopolyspora mesophila TaxID=2650750 RepID=A0A7K3M213_9ACTN|nr:GNAT family N-acetyltransferase [Phytoactinopolyspora mesophila]NDL56952.1 GNAT family N-acetyltransferase [Phytoactinopolyspora mesophila]
MTRWASATHDDPAPRGIAFPASQAAIRPITRHDLDAVGRLYAQCLPDDEVGTSDAAIADIHAAWNGEYGTWLTGASFLADVDGAPKAAVLLVDSPPWDDVRHLVFMIDLFTHPEHRRTGLGEALCRASLAAVPERTVGLRVDDENHAALGLYQKLGFVPMA